MKTALEKLTADKIRFYFVNEVSKSCDNYKKVVKTIHERDTNRASDDGIMLENIDRIMIHAPLDSDEIEIVIFD